MNVDSNAKYIKVWDILVRIFHWSLVFSFLAAFVTEDIEWLHIYFGYVVLFLVLFRVLWGFVGTKYALFKDFVKRPSVVIEYVKSIINTNSKRYIGHNPAGGVMVLALLFSLFMTSMTGIKLQPPEERIFANSGITTVVIGNAYADDDHSEYEEDELWEEVHEFFANTTMFLVFLHILGVIASSAMHNENLIKSMITGKKKK